ncbi:hypothetical protein [Isoptericola sp. BMS4]|uniref:hypothetical protein n=1 Tax=Isoptericola sp. BMS4 TaxID=2527875 RepID=UPI0014212C92|nr:hypothetical protein [Isoptericola sp. BMS4]
MTSDLEVRSREFAGEIGDVIAATLGDHVQMVSVKHGDRYVVRPDGATKKDQRIQLHVQRQHLADLAVAVFLQLDHAGEHLKATRTDIAVYSTLDRTPLVRLDYLSDMRTDPVCHWQFHGERGAFSHLLAIAHAKDSRQVSQPHDLSSVHLPVGGERFRPCLEDVLEMLIRDCGVDAVDGWQTALEEGRERWRMRQFRTTVRDLQQEAADVLEKYGWAVSPPGSDLTSHLAPYRQSPTSGS